MIALVGLKLDLAQVGMPLLVFGVVLERNRQARWRGTGQVLLGIGLLFLGIDQMKAGFAGLDQVLIWRRIRLRAGAALRSMPCWAHWRRC
ncbi:hypothetical protein UMZ34_10340 [Halopseudomonas pachastrellae]|nr:hypothetical protein UMZ34_10340 [Halopseudomonas pachastrellae]